MSGGKYFSFIALGGENNVGGSCYALRAGKNIILLDAGVRYTADLLTRLPDTRPLYDTWGIESLMDVDALVISHSHADHAGALPYFAGDMGGRNIFSSEAVPDMLLAQNSIAASVSDMIAPVPWGGEVSH
ncbi:MAG: MBL fold metallo-hydrolase [Synergistaceae bacterium]|nr:MBL fold metallo-hydrolase [Synergistaceae bacterium]